MSKNPGISRDLFDLILADTLPAHIVVEEKAAWTKVECTTNGLRMYIAKQKTVRQVDLSGFGKGLVGTLPLKAPNGQVQAHLDLGHQFALEHFEMLMLLMPTLTAPEKVKAFRPKATAPASSPVGPVAGSLEDRKSRRDLIAAVAAAKGVAMAADLE